MSSEHDELMTVLKPFLSTIGCIYDPEEAADAILAAGWRKVLPVTDAMVWLAISAWLDGLGMRPLKEYAGESVGCMRRALEAALGAKP